MLTGLTVLGDTGLELTSTGGNDENGAVSLGGTSDHVLDEITVTGGVDDGDVVPVVGEVSQCASACPVCRKKGTYLGVSNFQRAISMVIPRSRSDFSLSRTHAYLKEPLPSSAAS